MTKPRTMPVHDGSRSDQNERLPPPGPASLQRNPEPLVQGRQSTARSLRVQSQQLLTKGEVFKDKVLPGTKSADHRPEEMPERRPVDAAHHDVQHFVLVAPDLEDRHDVRVDELSAGAGLAHESLGEGGRGGLPQVEHLHRDVAVLGLVPHAEDRGEAPLSEQIAHGKFLADGFLEAASQRGDIERHGGSDRRERPRGGHA